MKTLTTARLRLRRASEADADFICNLMTEPGYLQFVGDRGVRDSGGARAYLRTATLYDYGDHGRGFNVVELLQDRNRIGICGLLKRDSLPDIELGYAILSEFSGQGYATEAASAALEHAHNGLSLTRVTATTYPGNHASRRVLEKIGMHLECMVRPADLSTDLCLYASHQLTA